MNKKIHFRNYLFNKKELKHLVHDTFLYYGTNRVTFLADNLKELGFFYATKAGISLSIEDLKVPPKKFELLSRVTEKIENLEIQYNRGEINTIERFQNVVNIWNTASEDLKDNLVTFFKKTDPLNPLYLMAFSGARGNISQIRQLVGMRGLMSDPKGQIIDIPILHNFREGLTNTDYIMSAYGARKGVVDTALRTADSGYLTRRLIDVAQDVIIRDKDCRTRLSISICKAGFTEMEFCEKIFGRASFDTIISSDKNYCIIEKNKVITLPIAKQLFSEEYIEYVKIRSPLTCELTRSICSICYGWDLAYSQSVKLGQAVGIIAAQSIGEPGTQLTMRTFHTGGIFTADPSRQIRAKESGFISFSVDYQGKKIRTGYGTLALRLESNLLLKISDYQNRTSELLLTSGTTLFVENNSFVKARQVLAELPLASEETISSSKYIPAKTSGLVKVLPQHNLVWILSGKVYDITKSSFLNKFTIGHKLSNRDSIFSFKLVSKSKGMVYVNYDIVNKNINEFKIFNSLKTFSLPVFFDRTASKFLFVNSKKNIFILEPLPELASNNVFLSNKNLNSKYKAISGGNVFYENSGFYGPDNLDQQIVKKNGKILYALAEVYYINKDASLLMVLNGSYHDDNEVELVKNGVCSRFSGLIQTEVSNKIIQKISVKPGKFFEYCHLTLKEKKYLLGLDNKIFFPGEIIFDDVSVDYLTLVQVTNIKNRFGLLLRPLEEYNIPKRKLKKSFLDFPKSSHLNIVEYKSLIFNPGTYIETSKVVTLLNSFVFFQPNFSLQGTNFYLNYRFLESKEKKGYFYASIVVNEFINLSNFLTNKLIDQKIKISLNTYSGQYVEPYTILGKVSIIPETYFTIEELSTSYYSNSRIMLVGENDYNHYFNEYTYNNLSSLHQPILKQGDSLAPNCKIKMSGVLVDVEPFKCKIRKGTPLFLSNKTICSRKTGELIKKDDVLGEIFFSQIITGDIVQGLPKVEEVLEARKRKLECAQLATRPGFVFKRGKGCIFVKTSSPIDSSSSSISIDVDKYLVSEEDAKVSVGDFITLGQPLSPEFVNPHVLLSLLFEYYKGLNSQEDAAYLSFRKIQFFLIDKVKGIYGSQGVTIADKHIEVIIRQMTSKVQIQTLNSSFLLPDEIVELKHVAYINSVLQNYERLICNYNLVLLGITKASLLTNSFISAASFQQTTKILMESAIEGKIDWLHGLKENVIVGRLIPSGGGFDYHSKFGVKSIEN